MTPRDIEGYQRLRVGPNGEKLKVDGDVGPRTRWAMAIEQLPAWRSRAVLGALGWVGLRELGPPNTGPEIDAWLDECGVQPGNPWCAAFVSAVLRYAGIECREARVSRLAQKFPSTSVPLPGDIGYWLREDGTGHCGIVTGVSLNQVSMCEGNSADGVRVGLRKTAALDFLCPDGVGMPYADPKLPMLGEATR